MTGALLRDARSGNPFLAANAQCENGLRPAACTRVPPGSVAFDPADRACLMLFPVVEVQLQEAV
jgi:hypothetical protein